MKLLLAALLVVLAILFTVSLLGELEVFDAWHPLPVALLLLSVGAVLFGLAMRVSGGRGHDAQRTERLEALRREVDLDPRPKTQAAWERRFAFVSTQRDLLDAHAALRRETSGMRPWVRGLVILMGVAWIAGFAASVLGPQPAGGVAWVWLLSGSLVLWFFVFQPLRTRHAIRIDNALEQPVSLRFTARSIESRVGESAGERRWWRDLDAFLPTSRGLAFGFVDGTMHWLPARVFGGDRERAQFVEDVERRLAREALRFDGPPVEHRVVEEPWTYSLVALRYAEGSGGEHAALDLTMRRGEQERRLRFLRPVDVLFQGREPSRPSELLILEVPFGELDGFGVRVTDRRAPFGALELWAEDVVDLDAAEGAPVG